MPENDPSETWVAEQREANRARLQTPQPNDIIERRAELQQSGQSMRQIDQAVAREFDPRLAARAYWRSVAAQPNQRQAGEALRQTQAQRQQRRLGL